jgi:hypothetical protein
MPFPERKTLQLLTFVLVLLLIITSRASYFTTLELDGHEVWTMWQSVGTPAEIINRTPFDWGPLYYLVMAPWQALVGNHAETARALSVLFFALGSAFVYRAMQRLHPGTAPVLAMLLYAVSAGIIYLSLNIRGYALHLALLPLAFWLMLRYFWAARPTLMTGVLLVLSMAAMVYIHPTGFLACLLLGVFTLFAYPSRLMRWLSPGVVFILLTLPELQTRLGTASTRLESSPVLFDLQKLPGFFHYYSGQSLLQQAGWGVLIVLALFLFFTRSRANRRFLPLVFTVLAGFGMLVVLGGRLGFGAERHGWWLMLPVALLVAWGLAYLPPAGGMICSVLLAFGLFIPSPPGELDESARPNPPLGENFRWLAQQARWGDVVVIDPRQQCSSYPDEWDYYTRLFFPQGLAFVENPADYRRVWYVSADGWADPSLQAQVERGRFASVFNGPWNCLFRLYLAPPDSQGVLYDNGMRFHGYEIVEHNQPLLSSLVRREGEAVRLRLWWSADRPLDADYSVGLHLYDAGGALVVQSDSGPQLVHLDPTDSSPLATQTSQWRPDQFYVEQRTLTLPETIPWTQEGTHAYSLGLVVYQSWDNVRIGGPDLNADQIRILQSFAVRAW